MLRHLGRAGIAEMVERHCRCASLIAQSVGREPGIAVMNRVVLNQAILRFGDDDRKTLDTIARLQADGVAFAGGVRWRGVCAMRLSVSNYSTTEAEAARTAEAIVAAWRAVK
jgi:glutamate/tyrosine decarboxylase-like PLP-dependent enzyme